MSTSTRVNEIDLLRFIAAMAVVVYHYSFRGFAADGMTVMPYLWPTPATKYGSYGVELFFMISGFVILMTAGSGSLRQFAVSRIVRLYPAFWVCCTITFLFMLWIGAPRFTATLQQYLANMTMLHEFANVNSIDGVYWSLVVEMRFYLLVAIVLALGQIHRIEPLLAFWLAISIAMEFLALDAVRRVFITAYAGYFVAGATFYLVWAKGLSATRMALIGASWLLVVRQALQNIPALDKHYGSALNPGVVGGIITTFFIVMMLVSLKKTGRLGQRRWIMLGALTYPLYLIHQNIGYMIFNAVYPSLSHNESFVHLLVASTIAFVLVLAYLIHVLFEKRMTPPLKAALNRITGHVSAARILR